MLVYLKNLAVLTATFWLSKLLLLFPLVAVISDLELRLELALDHVSLQHILAVVVRAADFTFEGPIAKKNIMSIMIRRQASN